jgi:hypothetical protein
MSDEKGIVVSQSQTSHLLYKQMFELTGGVTHQQNASEVATNFARLRPIVPWPLL